MRILGGSIGLLITALVATTVAVHTMLNNRADALIAQNLAHEVVEFKSEKPAESASPVRARLLEATSRVVPTSDIVLVALLDGRVLAVSGTAAVEALNAQAAQWARLSRIVKQTSGTLLLPGGAARYTALPVRAAGDAGRGVFVAAVLTAPEHAIAWQVTRLQLEVGLASLVVAAALAWLMAGRVLRPIRATTQLARRINDANLTDRLPVRGRDEVSEMAATFNAMLDRLHGAFAAQRQFLADAGHELRTPITIVQGNLDTVSTVDPEDAETLALVADELARMSRLVDELSLLAASEQPDFLRAGPTDLGELGSSLAAKAAALGPRPWRTTSTLAGEAVLDGQRVTQAVMQLAANAVAHTAPDVQLELRFCASGDQLRFEVIDHGGGVAPEDRPRIFDRFVQLEKDRDHSTGLGLPIVAAIAAAHGGAVELTETPGGGATFTLVIPSPKANRHVGPPRGNEVLR
jgi:two-component system, OmpR family, sensor kinase